MNEENKTPAAGKIVAGTGKNSGTKKGKPRKPKQDKNRVPNKNPKSHKSRKPKQQEKPAIDKTKINDREFKEAVINIVEKLDNKTVLNQKSEGVPCVNVACDGKKECAIKKFFEKIWKKFVDFLFCM